MNRNTLIALVLLLALGAGVWFLLGGSGEGSADGDGAVAIQNPDPAAGALVSGTEAAAAAALLSRTETPLTGAESLSDLNPGGAEVVLLARDAANRPIADAWATATEDFTPEMPGGMRMAFGGPGPGQNADRHAADAQGRIRIPVPIGQSLQVEVASPAHQSKSLSLQPLTSGESLNLGPVALLAGAQVMGRVLDPAGQPVEGARVSLRTAERGSRGFSFGGGRNANTAADGRFSFTGVEPGNYLLEAEARGFAPARGETGAAITAKAGAAPADAVLRLQAGRVLEGMVVDPDRRPIAGAEVFLRSPLRGGGVILALPGTTSARAPDATTDSAGRFSLRGVEAGSGSRVSARASGYGLGWAAGDANAAELLIQLKPALRFGGVLLSPDGKPVAEAEVRLERVEDEEEGFNFRSLFDDHSATTDVQGRFLIEGLDPGVWTVVAHSASASSSGQRVDLVQDLLDQVVRLAPASVLTIAVARDTDGAPVADALVTLSSAPEDQPFGGGINSHGRNVTVRAGASGPPRISFDGDGPRERTGADGLAAFADLAQGRYQMRIEAAGYAHQEMIVVRERGSQAVVVDLLPGADLRVQVEDGAGLPLPGVEVVAQSADPVQAQRAEDKVQRTDDSGRAIFTGLTPGAWTVDYRAAAAPNGLQFSGLPGGGAPEAAKSRSHTAVPVTLIPGDAQEVVLRATGLCIPTAIIKRRGAALAGAEVRLEAVTADDGGFSMPHFGRSERTDANGRVRLQPSEPGAYEVIVTPGSGLPERREKVQLAAGPQEIEVDVRGGRISGLVLADGRVPANATAHLEAAPAESGGSGRPQPRGRFIAITASDDGNDPVGSISFGGAASTSAQVDGSGRFSFDEVPAGEYVVRISTSGFASWTSERIVLKENQEREIGTAALVSGGIIRGINRRSAGQDGPGGFLVLLDAGGNQAGFAQSGPDGAYEFKDLATGTYTLLAPPGYNSAPIEVKAGQTVTFDVPAN